MVYQALLILREELATGDLFQMACSSQISLFARQLATRNWGSPMFTHCTWGHFCPTFNYAINSKLNLNCMWAHRKRNWISHNSPSCGKAFISNTCDILFTGSIKKAAVCVYWVWEGDSLSRMGSQATSFGERKQLVVSTWERRLFYGTLAIIPLLKWVISQ